MATAFAVVVPFFFWGNPSGHDFEFHLFSWMEVLGQSKQGIIYPHWASLAHWGYGEARFLFYPPASWTLGALIGSVFPWKMVPGIYIWIALSASGFSMFLLARRWLDRIDAIFAAALYTANPYYIVIVYWRSAFAELLAGALLPLLLLFVLRMEREGRRMFVPLALVVMAAWLTNAPSAVMVNYSLALFVVTLAILKKSPRILVFGGSAVVMGAALAAFYILPAAYEEKWVNIAEVLAPGVRPQDNFLFTAINDPDHNRFNLLVSIVTTAEIVILFACCWLARRWRESQKEGWWLIVLWAVAAILLMLPVTAACWQILPELRFVQLPWRWLLCLNVGFALLASMGLRRWFNRVILCVGLLLVIASVWRRVQPPWWDNATDVAEMRESVRTGEGYEGTDEYVPAGDDPYELNKAAPLVATDQGGSASVRIEAWKAQTKTFSVDMRSPGTLLPRLYAYPAWRVEVNGNVVQTHSEPVVGRITIPVMAGQNQVKISFERTWDQELGDAISICSAALLLVFAGLCKRRQSLPS
jgi:6-pyruvoyl-tetrahydropterin synthase-like protein/uncharacterized protein DUF6077